MEDQYLFVYGWLKRNHHLQLPFEMPKIFLGEAYTYGMMYKVAEYPGIKLIGSNKVFGEIFELPPEFDWSKMDAFEHAAPYIEKDADYRRVQTTCYLDNEPLSCWIYEYIDEVKASDLIVSGQY